MMSLVSFLMGSSGAATHVLPSMFDGETQAAQREIDFTAFLEGLERVSGAEEQLAGFARSLVVKILQNQDGLQNPGHREQADMLSIFWQWQAGRALLTDELMILVVSKLGVVELDLKTDLPYLPPYVPGRKEQSRPSVSVCCFGAPLAVSLRRCRLADLYFTWKCDTISSTPRPLQEIWVSRQQLYRQGPSSGRFWQQMSAACGVLGLIEWCYVSFHVLDVLERP